jgi:hypothetical protein
MRAVTRGMGAVTGGGAWGGQLIHGMDTPSLLFTGGTAFAGDSTVTCNNTIQYTVHWRTTRDITAGPWPFSKLLNGQPFLKVFGPTCRYDLQCIPL